MYEMLSQFGFTKSDIFMIIGCPLFGAIGGSIRAGMMLSPIDRVPEGLKARAKFSWWLAYKKFDLVCGWVVVGFVTGLLVGLLFVGALAEGSSAIARVFALSILAGYSGSRLWSAQEKALVSLVERKLKEIAAEEDERQKKENENSA